MFHIRGGENPKRWILANSCLNPIKALTMPVQGHEGPLAFVDYAFGLQGVLLLVNSAFLFIAPDVAATPPSLLEGATPAVFHTIM